LVTIGDVFDIFWEVGASSEDCPIATKTLVMGVKFIVGKVPISLVSRW
jgi:hypothetical protein